MMENSPYSIEIFNLTKKYPLKGKNNYITALDNVNFKIKKGEIFGLLGPNGAGKTTLVSILTTLIQPTDGYANILGHNILKDPWFVKTNVGLMLGPNILYFRLTGYKNLKFFAKIYGILDYKRKIEELAGLFDLSKWLHQYVSNYSEGMKLKLALARALLIEPKILFLDEPMLGLDPKSVEEVISLLKSLNKTILLTSHQMSIVSRLCNRIGFLKEGKIIKIDTKENLKKIISTEIKIKVVLSKDHLKFIKAIRNQDYVDRIYLSDKEASFFIKSEDYFGELFSFLKDYKITSFEESKPTLNDVFLKLSEI